MSIDSGTVTITFDGEEYRLLPTIKAAKRISAHFGGFLPALTRLQSLDIDACVAVVRHGLNADDALAKRLDEMVWRANLGALLPSLVEYVLVLANGGAPLREQAHEGNGEAAKAA